MTFRFNAHNLFLSSALLLLCAAGAVAQTTVPVSGYEIFLGTNCVIGGEPATCKATFTGWTGTTKKGHWSPFPGTGQGIWSIQVNYTGQPMFNGSVTIVGGKWNFIFTKGVLLHGAVNSGTVTWPLDKNTSIGCGDGVAVGVASISVAGGGNATVTGCLHDLPKGSVIPPKIWGTFNF
ncbi:MAG: hypothetical protein WB952_18725 [Terriglobales bacterium]